ncbi:zinc ribbon domain-containing protein [Paenibacillus thermotolerans]|uniref:zinc ribbon domain-containing protein n=1 Tax=Paenibacillus thermotolerans TaxID=3027807 RepID=UPI002367CD5F|nr:MULTISPECIES: zinc ribbon domain-containing protein [unclassified Paenibacillus]
MSFMDKMKSGFSEASNKAKVMVEVNKLRMQNSGKKAEIERYYQEIGRVVFFTSVNRTSEIASKDVQPYIDAILNLEREIAENKKQIKLLSNEKDCVCGKSAPASAMFCPSCGATFADED